MIHSATCKEEIDDGQEYKLLAYDLHDGYYYFINKDLRDQKYQTTYNANQIVVDRYMPFRAYIFPEGTRYRSIGHLHYQHALTWAGKNAIETRFTPDQNNISYLPIPFTSKKEAIEEQLHIKRLPGRMKRKRRGCEPTASDLLMGGGCKCWNHDEDDLEFRL